MPYAKVNDKWKYINPNNYQRNRTVKRADGTVYYPNAKYYDSKGVFLGDYETWDKRQKAEVVVTPNSATVVNNNKVVVVPKEDISKARQILNKKLEQITARKVANPVTKRRIERNIALIKRIDTARQEALKKFREKAKAEGSFYRQTEANIEYVKNKIKPSKAWKKTVEVADVVSGGKISENRIVKQQKELNKEIERYNKDYEGKKELSPEQYTASKYRFDTLEQRQKKINEQKEAFATDKSAKDWVRAFLGNQPYLSKGQINEGLKKNKQDIKDSRNKIERLENKLKRQESKGKEAKVLKARIKLQEKILKSKFEEKERIKEGIPPKIIAGTVPIIPASLGTPTGLKGLKQGLKQLYGIGKGTKSKGKLKLKGKAKGTGKTTNLIKVSKAQQKKINVLKKKIEAYARKKKINEFMKSPLRVKAKKIATKLTPQKLRNLVSKNLAKIKKAYNRSRTYNVRAVGKNKNVFVYGKRRFVKPKFKLPKIRKPKFKTLGKLKSKYVTYVKKGNRYVKKYTLPKIKLPKIRRFKILKRKPKNYKYVGKVGNTKIYKLKKIPKGKIIKNQYGIIGNKVETKKRFSYVGKVGNAKIYKLKKRIRKPKIKYSKNKFTVDIRQPKPRYKSVRTADGRITLMRQKVQPKITVNIPREVYNKATRRYIQRILKNMKPKQKARIVRKIKTNIDKIKKYKQRQAVRQYQQELNKQFPRVRSSQRQILLTKSAFDFRRILTGSAILKELYKSRMITPSKFKQYQRQNLKSGQGTGQGQGEVTIITPTVSTSQAQAIAQPQVLPQILRTIQIPRGTKKVIPFDLNKKQKRKLASQGYKMGYNVYGKSGNKYLKINKKPLNKFDAISKGTYAIDKTTARTLKVEPVGVYKSLGYLSKKEKSYASRNKHKFRQYKVKKGLALKLKKKYIEKKRFGIDSEGEKRGLSLARWLAKQNPKKMKGGRIWYGWKSNRKIRK